MKINAVLQKWDFFFLVRIQNFGCIMLKISWISLVKTFTKQFFLSQLLKILANCNYWAKLANKTMKLIPNLKKQGIKNIRHSELKKVYNNFEIHWVLWNILIYTKNHFIELSFLIKFIFCKKKWNRINRVKILYLNFTNTIKIIRGHLFDNFYLIKLFAEQRYSEWR